MTITTTTARNDYTGAGSTGPYAYTFRIFAATDLLVVTRNTTTGVETPLAYVTDYSVTGVGEGAGGTITLTNALASGYTMAITRVVPIVQDTDLRNQGTFYPQTYEDALDYLTAIDQQQEDAIERSLKVGDAINPATFDTAISTVPAGAYLRVNAAGNAFEAAVGTPNDSTYTASGAGAVTRTVTSKLGDFLNVLDFGADPTGASDSTAKIQAAIDALPSTGGTVYLPPGVFLVSTLLFPIEPKVVNFRGAGCYATGLKMATAAGPVIKMVTGTFARLRGAVMSDFYIQANAASAIANPAHIGMLLTGWNNSLFERIRYVAAAGAGAGLGGLGRFIDVAAWPYLTYQNTFSEIDASNQYGPAVCISLNNGGHTVFENTNIVTIRNSWFYGLTGCTTIVDGRQCTQLTIQGTLFEDCTGARGVYLAQATTIQGCWFELLNINIDTDAASAPDGSSSLIMGNYFSGVGTSHIDTINARPMWLQNSGSGQTVTGAGVTTVVAQGASPTAPTITGGAGALTLVAATVKLEVDVSGRVTYLLRYTDALAGAPGVALYTVSIPAGYTIENMTIGVISQGGGDPMAWGIQATDGQFRVHYVGATTHDVNVRVTYKKTAVFV